MTALSRRIDGALLLVATAVMGAATALNVATNDYIAVTILSSIGGLTSTVGIALNHRRRHLSASRGEVQR